MSLSPHAWQRGFSHQIFTAAAAAVVVDVAIAFIIVVVNKTAINMK